MKNNYCRLTEDEVEELNIPNDFKGFFLSPFQFNLENGFVKVPEDCFIEMIEELVHYAKTKEPSKGKELNRMGNPQMVQGVDSSGYSVTYLGGGEMALIDSEGNIKMFRFRLDESEEQKDLR